MPGGKLARSGTKERWPVRQPAGCPVPDEVTRRGCAYRAGSPGGVFLSVPGILRQNRSHDVPADLYLAAQITLRIALQRLPFDGLRPLADGLLCNRWPILLGALAHEANLPH